MPKLEYFVVAESVSVDQATNTMSVFHILEEIRAPLFPAVIPKLSAVAHWNAAPDELDQDFQVSVRISFPDGKLLPFTQNFRMARRRQRTIANFAGLPISQPGTLTIEVSLNGQHFADHTIEVFKIDE